MSPWSGSVYKTCQCQSEINGSNTDILTEVCGEIWGKECWMHAMTQAWQ